MPAPRRSIVAQPLDRLVYVQAPPGWDPDTPAMFCQPYAKVLDNLVPRNGKVQMRQAFISGDGWVGAGLRTPINVRGHMVWRQTLYVGAPNTLGTLSHDETLWAQPTITTSPCGVSTATANYVQRLTGTTWANGLAANYDPASAGGSQYSIPGKSYTGFIDETYYVGGSAGAVSVGNYQIGDTRLCHVASNGGLTVATSASGSTQQNLPTLVTSVKFYQDRLWVLGGKTYLFGAWSSTALFFTNPLGALSGTDACLAGQSWADPVSGTQNVIFVDPNEADPGMGLASFNNRLFIFRRRSIYVLTGSTPSNYTVQLLSREFGCIDQQSIVETDHGVYFMSESGLCLTTGSSVVNVSGRVQRQLTRAVAEYINSAVNGFRGGDITAAYQSDSTILISIRSALNATSPTPYQTIWSGVYDTINNVWFRYTSLLFANQDTDPNNVTYLVDSLPGYIVGSRSNGQTISLGNMRGVQLEYQPLNAANIEHSNTGVDRLVNTSYAVPIRWQSGFLPLEDVGRFLSTSVRWWADYLYNGNSVAPQPPPIPISLYETTTNQVLSTIQLSALWANSIPTVPTGPSNNSLLIGSANRNVQLQHTTMDNFREVQHGQIVLENLNVAAPSSTGLFELYGVGVEYQQARNLR